MLKGINVEEVKKYNEILRAHKDRASKLRAEIEFNVNELTRICNELTTELGIQVTPENLDSIYNERVAKINSTLETGKEILKRISEEELAAKAAQQASNLVQQEQNEVQQVPVAPPMVEVNNSVFGQSTGQSIFASLDGGDETLK